MRKNKHNGRESERGRSCSDAKYCPINTALGFHRFIFLVQTHPGLDSAGWDHWCFQSGPDWARQTHGTRATALQPKLIGGIFTEGFPMTHLMTNRFGCQATTSPQCFAARPYQMEKKKKIVMN